MRKYHIVYIYRERERERERKKETKEMDCVYLCVYIYIYISEGGIYPYRRISSLRTLTGLGQRSWVVVVVLVPRPGTVPPQGIGGREYIK